MAAAADAGTAQIDQKFLDKQSRTIGTYGLETMAKLISFKVLIVGCGGIGAETAKNLALAGIHTISLHDPRRPTLKDLGVNFAIAEDAIGKSKSIADLTASYISDLNPNTRVKAVTELTEAVIAKHTAVIFTTSAPDLSLKTLIKWNYFCRRHAPTISFILVTQTGAYGSIFVDHGDRFLVRDPTGQPPVQKAIESISTKTDKSGKEFSMVTFSTPDGQLGGMFEDYCKIQFTEVQGMVKKDGSSINGKTFDGVHCDGDPRFSVRFYPSFASQGFSEYKQGGFLKECPKPVELHCRPLEEALHSPGPIISAEAFSDGQSELRMHLQTHALLKFAEEKNGKTPSLHSTNDAQRVVTLVKEILEENRKRPVPSTSVVAPQRQNAEFPMLPTPPAVPVPAVVDALDEHIVLTEAMITEVELQPLACFFGAVAAQEVVKIAGKYSPINQWFHLSMEQVLPDKVDYTSAEYKPTGTRYDHLVSIFGKTFQDKLLNLRMFMIGCGALGCEDIKNFALCGLSCGPKGSIVITDNDRIEVSNLSRQFLFREDNVGQPKSVAAGKRIAFMNPKLKVNAMQEFVGPTTEHIFTDVFWEKLDVAVNALDNVEARVYVDSRCVTFNKVLVEGGTMGTGGSVDIIVPGQTTSYSDGSTAPSSQGGIPMCTLRNFPYIFEHCIEWSRAMFDDIFVAPFQKAVQIIDDSNDFVAKIMAEVDAAQSEGEKRSLVEKNMEPLKDLKRTLTTISQRPTMDDCAKLGWELLFKMFRDRILDLQSVFPKDAKKKNGDLFWSGHRKFPKAVEVDAARLASSPDAEAFLISTINLYACALGVHPTKHEPRYNDENNRWMAQYRSTQWIQSVANKLPVPKYIARQVEGLDEETAADAKPKEVRDLAAEEAELRQLLQELRDLATNCASAKCVPLEFEKDDDDNFQIDFIAAMSNLRATNYVIPTQDRMKVKLTAGKIIPAIATTTSAVAALGLIELFKVLQNKSIDDLRAGMLELGTNYYVLFSRDPPIKYRTSVTETFLPEQGITWKKKTIRVPNNHSKYDFIDIPITPKTTVKEVADAILPHLNATLPAGVDYEYEIDGFGVGKGMIWNGRPSHANTNVPIMKAIETQKKSEVSGELPKPFWEQRTQFCDLSVAVSVDDGDDSVDDVEVIPAPIRLLIRQ